MLRETKKYSFLFFLLIAGGLLFSSGGLLRYRTAGGLALVPPPKLPLSEVAHIKFPQIKGVATSDLEISAKAVLVKDTVSHRILYAKNENTRLPIASLTKLLTALVVKKLVSPEAMVEISADDASVAAYRANFEIGQKILVSDLLKAMLVASANDAAAALSRHAGGDLETFVAMMNVEASRLQMTSTLFQNPVGFDDPSHYSTAADLSLLVEEFIKNSDLMRMVGLKEIFFEPVNAKKPYHLVSTNKLLERPGVLGIKTGYTNEAKGNIIILVEEPRYFLIILGSDNREADANKLIDWVESNFVWQ